MDFQSLSNLMLEKGLVGCGGAGFPSYAKLNKDIDTLIVNCAECEPLLRLHRQLMERKTKQILEALEVLRTTLEVSNVKIALKKVYTKTIEALNNELKDFPNISLALLNEIYPAGDEVTLIYKVTGRVVAPGKLPASQHVLVYNTETIYNLYRALNGKAVTHKYVTVTGEVKEPHTFYAPIGSLVYGLIKRSGGATISDYEILIGGPMMGRIGHGMDVVTKTTNAIIVLPKDHPVIQSKKHNVRIDIKRAMAACCQCNYCTDLCPRHLLGHPIDPARIMRIVSNNDMNDTKSLLNAFACCGCGVCDMYACHQGLSPRNIINQIKGEFRKNGVKPPLFQDTTPLNNDDLKRVPLPRLRNRLGLEKYNHPASIYLDPINAKEVDILLNQHIGVPAIPVVNLNQYVKEGDVIAKAQEGKLSVNIHASIDGTIVSISNEMIKIKA